MLNNIITLYRDEILESPQSDDTVARYRLGHLKAKILGIRIPAWLGVLLTTGGLDYVK